MRKLIVIVLLSSVGSAHAQFDKILLPATSVLGGYGSNWLTTLTARNGSNVKMDLFIASPRPSPFESSPALEPGQTAVRAGVTGPRPGVAVFAYVLGHNLSGQVGDAVSFNYRLTELSRQALTAGVDIPVVRERDAHTGRIDLLNIPVDDRFRQALRIYSFDGSRADVRVRMYTLDPARLDSGPAVVETTLALLEDYCQACVPSQVAITDLTAAFPQLPRMGFIRIEIEPITAGLRLWAVASVTHKETQHVTLITPQ